MKDPMMPTPGALNKSHKILERGAMKFRPFGTEITGETIRDVSGITVKANVEYLAELIARSKGPDAGKAVLQELANHLNDRIPDPSYHVTPVFLTNPWHGYSYEFVMYLAEFSVLLSQDPDFHRKLGRDKFLSPLIQTLGRPFSIQQIFKLFPHFVEKFTKGALLPEVVSVSPTSAILRLRLSPQTRRQFGIYAYSCAERLCQSGRMALSSIPSRMFHLPSATVTEPCCMSDGAEFCEWHFSWVPQTPRPWGLVALGSGFGVGMMGILSLWWPRLSLLYQIGFSLASGILFWVGYLMWANRKALHHQRLVNQEQLDSLEDQHEELQRAYTNQEQTTVELRRHVRDLTMYHTIAQRFSATLDQESVIHTGLQAMTQDLHYNCALIALFAPTSHTMYRAQRMDASAPLSHPVPSLEGPITDPETVEGHLLLKGKPLFIPDATRLPNTMKIGDSLLLKELQVHAFVGIPLTFHDSVLGLLLADRGPAIPLTNEDVGTLTTIGQYIALALHNAQSYQALETLNKNLERKIQERTSDLERLNQQLARTNSRLKEFDRLKSQFLSHCSHELRTPLAAIKGFSENLLEGFAGPLNSKQEMALNRIHKNSDRLTRLISDLLDLSQIEAGRLQLHKGPVDVRMVAEEVVQHLQPLLDEKNQHIQVCGSPGPLIISADQDRITQVFLNLLHNASKFTPVGGRITLGLSCNIPGWVDISVTDHGPGIPSTALNNLFDPFFQVHRDQNIGTKGLGLGLAIVKELVDLHHGTIHVQSKLQQGTTFHVTLPTE